jgi:hypothetical protein
VKKFSRALTLTSALTLAVFTAAHGQSLQVGSTCWLTCISLSSGVTYYTAPNITKSDCCSGAAMSCPPGAYANYSWGEPAEVCAPGNDW